MILGEGFYGNAVKDLRDCLTSTDLPVFGFQKKLPISPEAGARAHLPVIPEKVSSNNTQGPLCTTVVTVLASTMRSANRS